MSPKIRVGNFYKIVKTDPLFSDWLGVVAECKAEKSGLYEMHFKEAYIYCSSTQLRRLPKHKLEGKAK